MKQPLDREVMAMRVAREFQDGDVVNLGIGIPTLASGFVPEGRSIIMHSESGVLGYGPIVDDENGSVDLINAGGQFVSGQPGMSYFGSIEAFAMMRGGRIDIAVLGALQVSERGDLANWMLPGRGIGNVGGAMDLAAGAKRIIAVTDHARDGVPKDRAGVQLPHHRLPVRRPHRDRYRRHRRDGRRPRAAGGRPRLHPRRRPSSHRADPHRRSRPEGSQALGPWPTAAAWRAGPDGAGTSAGSALASQS